MTTQQAAESGQLIVFGGNNTSGAIEVATACNAKGGTGRSDFESETFAVNKVPFVGVRRLTPTECERLQGFPDIEKSIIMQVCSDHQKTSANVESLSHRLLRPVGNVEKNDLPEIVKYAVSSLNINNPPINELVAVYVQINLERQVLQIHSQEKLLLSVNIAEKENSFPLRIPTEDFVRLVALMLTIQERIIHNGRVELPRNTTRSIPLQNGSTCVKLFGQEINELANDAEEFTKMVKLCLTFTTLEAEQNSPNSDWMLTILSYCVASAIVSSIPEIINPTSSYNLKFSTTNGWTANQSDSARYRQLGNAVAVPVVEWIARRINETATRNPPAA